MMKEIYENFKSECELFFVSKFIDSESIKKTYSDCLDIIFDITKTVDSGRGIVAFNQNYGQGKSFFFDVVNHRYKRFNEGKNFYKRTTAKELAHIYTSCQNNEDPQDKLIEFISVKRLFIDDIGDEGEKKIFKHYANELNVLRFVILKRYEWWVEKGWITYGTTNLTIEQIGSNYDGRCADRLLQMCYWKEFKFLKEGSFRQIEETRKLKQSEINSNWEKFKIEKPIEKVDLEKYFNELIRENDKYFENKDVSFWGFVKDYLIEKEYLSDKDFEEINEQFMDSSELILRRDTRQTKRMMMKHTTPLVMGNEIDRALNAIKRKDIINVARNMIARKKFMELRTKKHIFK